MPVADVLSEIVPANAMHTLIVPKPAPLSRSCALLRYLSFQLIVIIRRITYDKHQTTRINCSLYGYFSIFVSLSPGIRARAQAQKHAHIQTQSSCPRTRIQKAYINTNELLRQSTRFFSMSFSHAQANTNRKRFVGRSIKTPSIAFAHGRLPTNAHQHGDT